MAPHRIFLTSLLWLAASVSFAGDIAVPLVRQAGIDYSTQNEVDQVFRLATEWLAARQGTNGAWRAEDGPSILLTAEATLALAAVNLQAARTPMEKGIVWLRHHEPTSTNDTRRAAETQWRETVLTSRDTVTFPRTAESAWAESTEPEHLWRLAREVNRGRANPTADPWRERAVRRLVDGFRKDPAGGGFWPAATEAERIRQTALAIFAIRELAN